MKQEEILELGLRQSGNQITERSDNYMKIYSNSVQMAVSVWDMNLVFGEIIGDENGTPIVEHKVKVNMSKEFAKAVLNLLKTNIAEYEANFGEIKLMNRLNAELKASAAKKPTPRKATARKKA